MNTRTSKQPMSLVVTLALCLGIQAITTDLYLPSLPLITRDLGSEVSYTQLTLSMLLVFFGIGQLVAGPLSDKWGRRPILIFGLFLYSLMSIAAGLASNMTMLIVARSLQGFFMAFAVVCARALPRDLYQPDQAAAVISKGLTGLGIIACLSPVVGGLLASWLGWRASLFALSVFGMIGLLWIVMFQKETIREYRPDSFHLPSMWKNWSEISKNIEFRNFTLLASASYGGLFIFLASSSFVFTKVYGLDSLTYSYWLIVSSISYIAGTVLCRRLLKLGSIASTVKVGGYLALISGIFIVGFSLAGFKSIAYFMPFHVIFMVAHGINLPCATAGAVGPFPEKAGSAAALSGFIMMVVAFCTGLILGKFLTISQNSVYPLTLGMGFWIAVVSFVTLFLIQRPHNH